MSATILIPTYRRGPMLTELLASLAPQIDGADGVDAVVIDNDPEGSARAIVAPFEAGGRLRYVWESRRGIVHARNRGLAEATGDYILFLDDDQVPGADWLAAWLAQADGVVKASFGRTLPRYAGTPPTGLKTLLDSLFTRDFDLPTGADITHRWAFMATHNSMFLRSFCFPKADPFDIRFNARGGEDIWLLMDLMRRGARLQWNREALAEELVPADRMTLAYLKGRKFNHAQLRVIFMRGAGGARGWANVALWMGIGALQVAGHGARAAAFAVAGNARKDEEIARVNAGLGKLLWWRSQASRDYGA